MAADVIFFLDVFAKNEKSDLTKSQLKELAHLIREEQGRCVPDGPSRLLLRVLETNPETVLDVARSTAHG